MGTNYYALTVLDECESCGREGRKVHLGKTSAGWPPILRLRQAEGELPGIESYVAWERFVRSEFIVHLEDEYGEHYSPSQLIERLERVYQKWPKVPDEYYWYRFPSDAFEKTLENGWRGLSREFS